ncbi:hypothetical protein Zmor_003095 [Zophobas morio]|uniref:B-cell lymphoma 9 beta-catenin binding domain-containing protein n=1 Tax=Zophobas morio TaxID=2755281 RepID=A0AA38M0X1_9CUCU|nr:hypothetical protein Zmor_003095 [Zophobas morio]
MIKEKHEKGSESVKEEPGSSDKEAPSTDVRIKKEDEAAGSNCAVKKEPGRPVTKNGGIIGSTNTGSLQAGAERKTEGEEATSVADPANLTLKTEECIDNDLPGDAFALGLSGPPPHPTPPDGVQPLASNVINKQPGGMEVQYMQQQSQIFVFSTNMANNGADEVLQGRYATIIAYHCAQPATKKYLEKNPLKVNQFTRQNPAQWLNNLAMMKNKGCTRSPGLGPKSQPSIDNFLGPDGLDEIGLGDADLPWDQKNNHHLEGLEGVSNGLPDVGPDMDACSPSLSNVQPSLQGVKVPDENLTPQQRQHREEQLATIRKMQQMLFPENQAMEGQPPPGNASAIDLPHGMMPGGPAPPGAQLMSSQLEWLKMHQFDERKPKPDRPGGPVPIGPVSSGAPCSGPGGPGPRGMPAAGPRLQGPPPPYHQTPRSASVPIALQSPSPASPNNPTSNLSLPSPRASSALNSPADPNRQFGLTRHVSTGQSPTSQDSPSAPRHNHSNPGTPVSSHLSPSVNSSNTEPTSTHQSSVDGMFGRTLQSMAQQKQMNTSTTSCSTTPTAGAKEPNLMPVPSPQQIQYLNAFEGQELIIQKQPNTSLKERNMISPPILPTTLDSGFPGNTSDLPHTRISGPNTPTSVDVGPRFPPTPGVSSEGCRFQIPSPHTPSTSSTGDKSQRLTGPGPTSAPGMSPQTAPGPTSDPLKGDLFPTPSPHMMDVPRFPGPNASPGAKMGGGFVNVSPSGKPSPLELPNYCARGDNVPLNPNCTSTMSGNAKVSHFDPISSLAQMSQQLTNSVASSLNGQGNQGPGMMNFGSPSMQMMEMGACHNMPDMDQGPGMMGMGMQGPPHGFHPNSPMAPIRSLSPKLPGAFPNHMPMPRMMGRPPGPNPYNGANVQVKPNAPNTIQYLPAKPQVGSAPGPRGPPSLDFLQRFANPLSNMDSKMPTQNLQYFPNNGPMQGPGGPMPPHMAHMDGPMQPDPMMGGPMGNGAGPMMAGGMGMPGGMLPMMRGPMRPPGMMRMPQMGFNGPAPGGPEMFNPAPGMGNPNAQMFVSGPKGSPMGMAPDASQPLPPSMGQNNTFKNSPFVGPSTSDPNYAQQYHNFQQQLYATGTRSQMGGQAMGPGPGPPHTQQPPYFNPK